MFIRRLSRTALDLLLPPHCLTCDADVQQQGTFCAACFTQATFISASCCDACGVPFAFPGQALDGLCPRCIEARPPWRRARAAFAYDHFSRHPILQLKHADRTDIATALAAPMRRAGAALLAEADLLVPVPLHRTRLFARRYNQSALLARAITRLTGHAAMPDALIRPRRTATLAGKDHTARAAELHGAIAVRPTRAAALVGRRVLLIDDVLTSGATAGACTQALLAAGAAAVDVLVAARVPDPRLKP
jgi:ComF family protein